MTTNPDCILVHTLWQGDDQVNATRCRLRVIDPAPVFFYHQHGRTIISPEPMLRVEYHCNEGRMTGVTCQGALAGDGLFDATERHRGVIANCSRVASWDAAQRSPGRAHET